MLMKACQLAYPDPNAPLALTSDASKTAIGAVLEQYNNKKGWEPLGFWSKHLKVSEQAWSPFRRVLYAIQQGMRHFTPETDGRHVMLYTDHKALLGAFKSTTGQAHDPVAFNHIQEVAQKTTDIRYLSGKANAMADLLSRPQGTPLGESYCLPKEEEIATLDVALELVNHKALAADQQQCPEVRAHKAGNKPRSVKMEEVEFSPGVTLYCEVANRKKARPLVPAQWQDLVVRMFQQLHHPGQRATVRKVEDRYYWPDLRKDVARFVRTCTLGQVNDF